MNYFTSKKTVVILIAALILSSFNAISQNTYLSFKDGSKTEAEGVETTPTRTYQSLKSLDVEIGYSFSGAYVADKSVENEAYNFLHIDGFNKMMQVGAPALPSHNDIIAIPRGAVGEIVILEAKYNEYDGFMVHPTLEPARDTEGAPSPEFKKDENIYSKDEFFPKEVVEIVSVGLNRGTGLATTQIRPVQFNPVTGKIRVYTSIKYRLETIGGEGSFDYISAENTLNYTNLLKQNVINSESIPDGFSSEDQKKNRSEAESSEAKNYIIITHSQFLSQANALANWKRQLGYSVEVVSQSSWTAAEVKTEIYNRYTAWTPKPDYFVIIGDHTGSYAVPGEIHQDPSYGNDFATDLYVACMDGGTDHMPDMAHGRISVSTDAEATVVINKIINYEKTPTTNTDFYSNILNCAQYQDVEDTEAADGYAARRFCHTSEEIRDYLQDNYSYNSTRVYNSSTTWDVTDLHYNNGYYSDGQLLPAELRNASFNWNGGSADITSAIDAGKFLVFHRDHGYSGGSGWHLPYYTTTSMTSLNNGDKLPVVFSMNCHTGEFQLDNCFAEKFVRMENKGAVGVVGAAYYSYSGYNDALSEGMIDAIWSDPGLYPDFGSAGTGGTYTNGAGNEIYTMGDVVNQGLNAMVQNYGDNTYTYELFHYFGDPAMKIWTSNPNDNSITATHSATIDCAGTSFSITGSIEGALATLVFKDELIAQTTIDASGNGTLTYSISESGTEVILTISKHNNKPYTSDLTVSGSCGFPPSLETQEATSVVAVSAVLNGEILDDSGEAVSESGFVYSTTSDPLIGGGDVVQVQTDPLVTTGAFSEDILGLSPLTTYYVKAYAINTNGTAYGEEITFITDCNVPGTQATNFAVTIINDNDLTITWTSAGDHVLVVAKEGSAVDVDPANGVTYTANSDFTSGEDLGSGNIAVYSGIDETITVSNLQETTDYYFAIYKYNDTEKCYNIVAPATGNATTTGYCKSYATSSFDTEIDEVIFNTINVNSAGICASYTDNSNIDTDVEQGMTYSLSVTTGSCGGDYPKAVRVFIDWNGDEDFEDTNEIVYTSTSNAASTNYTTEVEIPEIFIGSVKMRVVCVETSNPAGIMPCGEYSWGETEDYTVNIIALSLPIVSTTLTDLTGVSITTESNITNEGASSVTERGIVWSLSSNPTFADNVITDAGSGLGTYSSSITGLSSATNYYVRAYATNGSGTRYSNELEITTLCEPPTTQATSLAVTNITDNEISISWVSDGDHVIVITKEGSPVDTDPFRAKTYMANSDITLGEDIGSGNIAVYSGTAETVTITNLLSDTEYYFAVYKYTDSEMCYNTTSPATGNDITTGYCQASGGGTIYFNSVTLGDIANLGTGYSSYADYTSLSTDLEQGSTNTLTIENGYVDSFDDLGVWIDFNDNDSFDDAGENVICEIDSWADNYFDLIIPVDATLGSHRMRIRTQYFASNCSNTCGTTQYGEVEDYTVNITLPELPIVETLDPTNIDATAATVGGNVINEGSSILTEKGIVWNISGDPTLLDNVIIEGTTSTGTYNVSMTGLDVLTNHYVRAYATNSNGTSYGTVKQFTTDCNPPITQAGNISASSINNNDITLNWISGGDYVLVLAKEASAVDVEPFNGDIYTANSDITLGEDLGTGNIAVYSGTSETVTITNLTATTRYYFAIYKYNDAEYCYNTISPATENFATGYCVASGGGTAYIDGVILEDITTTATGANAYEDYSSLTTDLEKGSDYTLSITNPGSTVTDDIAVWIDYNDNNILDDVGENVICSVNDGAHGDYILSVPMDAPIGNHRLRIRIKNIGDDCGFACGTTTNGEVEDYTVNIIPSVLPLLETKPVSEITNSSATVSGEIFEEGESAITERGFVYNTTGNPTLADMVVIEGSTGIGVFTSDLSDLTESITYYIRAYATNGSGTKYGNEVSFYTHDGDIEVTQVYT